MAEKQKAFLGTGWFFPVQADPQTGRIMTVSQEEDIAQAIRIILSTRPGERIMQPEFGCDLYQYVFGNIQKDEIIQIQQCVQEALRKWEPRIIETEVHVDTSRLSAGVLLLEIRYRVRVTNTPYNLVFPYYIREGI